MARPCSAPNCRCVSPCDDYYRGECDECGEVVDERNFAGLCRSCEDGGPGPWLAAGFDESLADRLFDAGYVYGDGEFEKTVSNKTRTARRDHKDGRFKAGDVYVERVVRTVYADGCSRMRRRKTSVVLTRAMP